MTMAVTASFLGIIVRFMISLSKAVGEKVQGLPCVSGYGLGGVTKNAPLESLQNYIK